MNKDSLIMYRSFFDAAECLSDGDFRALMIAIKNYSMDGTVTELSGTPAALFALMCPVMDSANNKYNAAIENGKKGGRPKKNQSGNQNDNQSRNQSGNQNDNQSRNQNGNQNDNQNDNQSGNQNDNLNVDVDVDVDVDEELKDSSSSGQSGGCKKRPTSELDKCFERVWSVYPRKVGKKNARAAWMKLKPADDLVNVIVAAINQQQTTEQWQKAGGQFIPHLVTWLNQERWNDEPTKSKEQRTKEANKWSQYDKTLSNADVALLCDKDKPAVY